MSTELKDANTHFSVEHQQTFSIQFWVYFETKLNATVNLFLTGAIFLQSAVIGFESVVLAVNKIHALSLRTV